MKIIIPEYKLRALLKVPPSSSLEPFWVCTVTREGELHITGLTHYFYGRQRRGEQLRKRKQGNLLAHGK